jgi:hypothetical protein
MEYWNNDLKKMIFLYLIHAKRNFTITHLSIFSLNRRFYPPSCKPYWLKAVPEARNPIFSPSRRHYEPEASVPIFHHSLRGVGPTGRRPIASEAN